MKRVYLNEKGAGQLFGRGDLYVGLPVDIQEVEAGIAEKGWFEGRFIGGFFSGYTDTVPDQDVIDFAVGNFKEAFPNG